jgi:hypothetical protein
LTIPEKQASLGLLQRAGELGLNRKGGNDHEERRIPIAIVTSVICPWQQLDTLSLQSWSSGK